MCGKGTQGKGRAHPKESVSPSRVKGSAEGNLAMPWRCLPPNTAQRLKAQRRCLDGPDPESS